MLCLIHRHPGRATRLPDVPGRRVAGHARTHDLRPVVPRILGMAGQGDRPGTLGGARHGDHEESGGTTGLWQPEAMIEIIGVALIPDERLVRAGV